MIRIAHIGPYSATIFQPVALFELTSQTSPYDSEDRKLIVHYCSMIPADSRLDSRFFYYDQNVHGLRPAAEMPTNAIAHVGNSRIGGTTVVGQHTANIGLQISERMRRQIENGEINLNTTAEAFSTLASLFSNPEYADQLEALNRRIEQLHF